MHLVGLVIKIYHDARSPERQIYHEARSTEHQKWAILRLKCIFFQLLHVSALSAIFA